MVVITAVVVIFVLVLIFAYASIRILREYERGVVFTLGRHTGTKGPGLFLLVPFVQQMVRVDLRVVVDEVPPQDVISRDNVSVKVSACTRAATLGASPKISPAASTTTGPVSMPMRALSDGSEKGH